MNSLDPYRISMLLLLLTSRSIGFACGCFLVWLLIGIIRLTAK